MGDLQIACFIVEDTDDSKAEFIRELFELDNDFCEMEEEMISDEVCRIMEKADGDVSTIVQLAVLSNPTRESTFVIGNTTFYSEWDFTISYVPGTQTIAGAIAYC